MWELCCQSPPLVPSVACQGSTALSSLAAAIAAAPQKSNQSTRQLMGNGARQMDKGLRGLRSARERSDGFPMPSRHQCLNATFSLPKLTLQPALVAILGIDGGAGGSTLMETTCRQRAARPGL